MVKRLRQSALDLLRYVVRAQDHLSGETASFETTMRIDDLAQRDPLGDTGSDSS